MSQRFFVTGTDTDAGKTLVTAALLLKASQQGLRAFGLKPVAAGCEQQQGQWRNSDALLHQQYSTPSAVYEEHNPVALAAALAPHIAAAYENKRLSVSDLMARCQPALAQPHDLLLVEGAGGWLVPLNNRETLADFASELGYDVILVVGMKLGCINHALLSEHAIRNSGLRLAGWVANSPAATMQAYEENYAFLQQHFSQAGVPCLGAIPAINGLNPACPEHLSEIAAKLSLPEA